jgi:hypothetical protein
MNRANQYSLVEIAHKKWPHNKNDLDDDEYELPISKYDANQEALVKQTKRTLMEEEKEPRTPSQSAS